MYLLDITGMHFIFFGGRKGGMFICSLCHRQSVCVLRCILVQCVVSKLLPPYFTSSFITNYNSA